MPRFGWDSVLGCSLRIESHRAREWRFWHPLVFLAGSRCRIVFPARSHLSSVVMLRCGDFRNRLRAPVVVILSLLVATGSSFAMTRLLKKAFEKASELSEAEQDDFAEFILDELESERRWEQAFEDSQDELEQLADEALDEHEAGNSEELDSNRL